MIIKLSSTDNIGVCIQSLDKNQTVNLDDVKFSTKDIIPFGHKVALTEIGKNTPVIKYGQPIGIASKDINVGQHVHIHNVQYRSDLRFSTVDKKIILSPNNLKAKFSGFIRKDGTVGTRNYIVVIGASNCSATVVKKICIEFENKQKELSIKGIDGIVPVTYSGGCAQSRDTYAYEILNKTLAGWIDHSNVVGSLVVGLGCEGITDDSISLYLKTKEKSDMNYFCIQNNGGFKKSIELGIEKINTIIKDLPVFKREEQDMSCLKVALNCGGSDSFSGITANPVLGIVSDWLVEKGATVVLAEIPECHGYENVLNERCTKEADRKKLTDIFCWWDNYASIHGVNLNDNLATGNIFGGISTIIEKSLGAVSKAGNSKITQVVDYAERITEKGLVIMNTPGYDPVSVTGLVAGGCNIVAFATGKGSLYGASICPTIKISTNTDLYMRQTEDIDVNAGKIISEGTKFNVLAEELYNIVLEVASGKQTASEKNNIGFEEFVPWSVGETL